MHFNDDEETCLLLETVRRLTVDHGAPLCRGWEEEGRVSASFLSQWSELGIWGACVPAQFDGAELSARTVGAVIRELAQTSGALALLLTQHVMGCRHVLFCEAGDQQPRWLPKLARGEARVTWIDATAHCVVRPVAEGWSLEGRVGPLFHLDATAYGLVASDEAGNNVGLLVPHDAPGLHREDGGRTLGARGLSASYLRAEQVPVQDMVFRERADADNGIVAQLRAQHALLLGYCAAGLGRSALQAAVSYARQRQQFGGPIADFQAIQWKIADAATGLDAASLLLSHASWRQDQRLPFTREAAIAKLQAAAAAELAVDHAMQIHGGIGFTRELPVERFYRDALMCGILDPDTDTLRLQLASQVVREVTD